MTATPGDSGDAPIKDHVNRGRLAAGLIPLVLSLLVAGGLYVFIHHGNSQSGSLRIGIESTGSDERELLESIAKLLRERPDMPPVSLVINDGLTDDITRLERGEIDVAAISADDIARRDLTLVAELFPDSYHLIARADSGIKTIADLPGKHIAIPPETSSGNQSFWFLIGQYGLSPERMRTQTLNQDESTEAFKQGEVDALFLLRPPGDRRIRWLSDAVTLRILEIDQAAAMHLRRGALRPVTIPKGVYSGSPPVPAQSTMTVAAQRILVARADVPEDVIRDLTATLFRNRRELSLLSWLAGFIKQPDLNSATVLPVHPGALAYYDRNQPGFFQENAEPIGVVVSVIAILASLLLWLRRTWTERQKGRIDVYNLELVRLAEKARAAPSPQALSALKNELFEMLSKVVHDLDEDRIDGNGFHFFAFTWEAVLAAIHEAERQFGVARPELTDIKKTAGHPRPRKSMAAQ